jgi:2-dehydropantoate 2-reductase
MEMIRFGAHSGLPTQLLQASAKIWESAGFKVALFDDIGRMVWEKLIMNVAFSGSTCLTRFTIGEVMADPDAWRVARGCAEEAVAVASALGIRLEVGDPIAHIQRLGGKIANARPSMLLDHLARRRSEIDVINGSIPRLGATAGVATPVNATVVALVKARESRFSS